jgi:flavin reductase (DIM6/NTAB) family NADH-FMN oxidoreductase RutF
MQKQVDYSDAIKTKYPEQVVIAIAKDRNGKFNPITLGWTMIVSGDPPMMAIAVAKTHYSVEAITHSRCFTIAFPSSQMAEAALFFGSKSGRKADKFAEFDAQHDQGPCETAPAEEIDSLLLADAVANFECELESQVPAGDHFIFVSKIVCSHVNTETKKLLYTIAPGHKLGPAT